MTITNTAWVAAHMGAPSTVAVTGTVVDVVDAGDDARGAYLIVENEESGERAKCYVTVPLTDAELAEQEKARKAAEAAAQAEAEAASEADQARRNEAMAEMQAEQEKALNERVDERIRAILAEQAVTAK